jgi:hypothetical protein
MCRLRAEGHDHVVTGVFSSMNESELRKVRRVLLFSGHMIDAATRETPRFPPEAEPAAAREIDAKLIELKVRAGDIGVTEGACGGDLLFAEAMLARGASVQLRMPFQEQKFRKHSVAYSKKKPPADRWVHRFIAVRNHPRVSVQAMPPTWLPRHPDAYERCNLWMLRDALVVGAARVRFILLWNGEGGDGRGGTGHMMRCVQAAGGKTYWIDTRKLFGARIR